MLTHTTEVHPQKECHQVIDKKPETSETSDAMAVLLAVPRTPTVYVLLDQLGNSSNQVFLCVLCLKFGYFTHITVDDCEIQGKPPWTVFQHTETKKNLGRLPLTGAGFHIHCILTGDTLWLFKSYG